MKSPLITRKTYEREKSEHQSTKYRLADAERKIKELENEILPRVKATADKVAKIEWSRHRPPLHHYCLTIEFDEQAIQMGLIHGDSDMEIRYLADYIGSYAARNIKQLNFRRYVDEQEKRWYSPLPTWK